MLNMMLRSIANILLTHNGRYSQLILVAYYVLLILNEVSVCSIKLNFVDIPGSLRNSLQGMLYLYVAS